MTYPPVPPTLLSTLLFYSDLCVLRVFVLSVFLSVFYWASYNYVGFSFICVFQSSCRAAIFSINFMWVYRTSLHNYYNITHPYSSWSVVYAYVLFSRTHSMEQSVICPIQPAFHWILRLLSFRTVMSIIVRYYGVGIVYRSIDVMNYVFPYNLIT